MLDGGERGHELREDGSDREGVSQDDTELARVDGLFGSKQEKKFRPSEVRG